jgi:hypothetical protein
MDFGTIKFILGRKRAEEFTSKELAAFRQRKQRVFLQVLHEILSQRNDRRGKVEDWAECLLCVTEDTYGDIESFPDFLLRLAAFQQYREKKESAHATSKHGASKAKVKDETQEPLRTFLSTPFVTKLVNETISADGFIPSETDWMALNFLFKHNLIERRLYAPLLMIISGPQGLAGLLEITPEAWKPSIGYVLRQKVENIIFILFKMIQHEPGKYELMLTLFKRTLLNISARLEAGITAGEGSEQSEAESLDAGFFSSSDDEEEEEKYNNGDNKQYLISQIPRSTDTDDSEGDDKEGEGEELPRDGRSRTMMMVRKCIQAEENLPSYRNSWCELCLTAVTLLHKRLLDEKQEHESLNQFAAVKGQKKAQPVTSDPRVQSISDTISLLNSPTWQRQLLSLDTLVDILSTRNTDAAAEEAQSRFQSSAKKAPPAVAAESNAKTKRGGKPATSQKSTTTANSMSQRKSNTSGPSKGGTGASKPVEELCRSGYLRHLCWCLVSKKGRIRSQASSLLSTILDLSKSDHGSVGVDLWAAFVEQGLVPLLELVRLGYPVGQVPARTSGLSEEETISLFPEQSVRILLHGILDNLVARLQTSSPLRLRLASALIHAGNPTLRLNIFVALLFLARKASDCGMSIWRMRTPSQQEKQVYTSSEKKGMTGKKENVLSGLVDVGLDGGGNEEGEVFLSMLKALLKDVPELKVIVSIMAHTLRSAQEVKMAMVIPDEKDSKKLEGHLRGGPTVMVDDDGSLVKMVCPAPNAVLRHSPDLANILHQMAEKEAEVDADPFAANGSRPLPVLSGSYSLWQEIFSQMTSDRLQDSSISRMALDQIVDAFHIARKYRMPLLLEKYAQALGKRINTDTIVTVWSCGLGRVMTNGVHVDISNSSDAAELSQFLPAPVQLGGTDASRPPASPGELLLDFSSNGATVSTGRGSRAHLGLVSACFDWIEKNSGNAYDPRRPLLAAELLELTHLTLGLIIAG